MPVKLENSVIIEPEKQIVIPAKTIDVIDIVDMIIINTDMKTIHFTYNCYGYLRDENGNIQTDENGRKKVYLVKSERMFLTQEEYLDYYNKSLSTEEKKLKLGQIIERKLFEIIKQKDQSLKDVIDLELVDYEPLEIVIVNSNYKV